MAFEKSDYPDENITVREFHRALSEFLKHTHKDPLTVFEQLLDAGLKVSTGHLGYVGSTPIHPSDIKVAIRKARRGGKQGENILDTSITIQTTTAGEHLTNQELGDFQKKRKILRKKIQSEIDEGRKNDFTLNEGNVNSLSLEENQNAERLLDPVKKNLADLFINHADADEISKKLGEDSCPWAGQYIESKPHQEPPNKQNKTHIFKKDGDVWSIGPIDNPKSFAHRKGFVYIHYLLESPGNDIRVSKLAVLTDKLPEDAIQSGGHGDSSKPLMYTAHDEKDESDTIDGRDTHLYTIDQTAVDSYRNRLNKIESELKDAHELGDTEMIDRLDGEKGTILNEISSDTTRASAKSLGERTRKRIQKNIKDAQNSIIKEIPEMKKMLSIRTGNHCCYKPVKDVKWSL